MREEHEEGPVGTIVKVDKKLYRNHKAPEGTGSTKRSLAEGTNKPVNGRHWLHLSSLFVAQIKEEF